MQTNEVAIEIEKNSEREVELASGHLPPSSSLGDLAT
jgi:hypothetical protein